MIEEMYYMNISLVNEQNKMYSHVNLLQEEIVPMLTYWNNDTQYTKVVNKPKKDRQISRRTYINTDGSSNDSNKNHFKEKVLTRARAAFTLKTNTQDSLLRAGSFKEPPSDGKNRKLNRPFPTEVKISKAFQVLQPGIADLASSLLVNIIMCTPSIADNRSNFNVLSIVCIQADHLSALSSHSSIMHLYTWNVQNTKVVKNNSLHSPINARGCQSEVKNKPKKDRQIYKRTYLNVDRSSSESNKNRLKSKVLTRARAAITLGKVKMKLSSRCLMDLSSAISKVDNRQTSNKNASRSSNSYARSQHRNRRPNFIKNWLRIYQTKQHLKESNGLIHKKRAKNMNRHSASFVFTDRADSLMGKVKMKLSINSTEKKHTIKNEQHPIILKKRAKNTNRPSASASFTVKSDLLMGKVKMKYSIKATGRIYTKNLKNEHSLNRTTKSYPYLVIKWVKFIIRADR